MCDYDDEQSTVFTRHITGEEQAAESHRSSTATVKPVKYNFIFSVLNLNSEECFFRSFLSLPGLHPDRA